MSIEAMTWALRVPVGGNAKVVLLGMANHAHPDGTDAYPSLDTLAAYAHCDRSTARRQVNALVAAGWLIEDGVGPRRTNRYRLPLGRRDEGGKTPPSQNATVAPAPPEGGKTPRLRVAPMPPEPSKEPSPNRPDDDAGARGAWGDVETQLRKVPEWTAALIHGSDLSCQMLVAANTDVPWPQIAARVAASRLDPSGGLRTNSPRTALDMGLRDHREGRDGRSGAVRPRKTAGSSMDHYAAMAAKFAAEEAGS